jgi:hypothetical protein
MRTSTLKPPPTEPYFFPPPQYGPQQHGTSSEPDEIIDLMFSMLIISLVLVSIFILATY